jgi:hypothetical protein
MKIAWWKWLPFQGWRAVGAVESADEVPDRLPRRAAVLVGSGVHLKWLAFDCPCGRDHRILLNADPARSPAWLVAQDDAGRLTISPSIDALSKGRRCHYFIRTGRTLWAEDSDR